MQPEGLRELGVRNVNRGEVLSPRRGAGSSLRLVTGGLEDSTPGYFLLTPPGFDELDGDDEDELEDEEDEEELDDDEDERCCWFLHCDEWRCEYARLACPVRLS